MKGILGRKLGMTQIFTERGEVVPVTVIEAGPCFVTQIKTEDSDGYNAIQLGFEETKPFRLTKPEFARLKKNNLPPLRRLKEVRLSKSDSIADYKLGQKITCDLFKAGELVDVTGISKGKGFQGGMKRHHFGGGPMTHGQSDRQRSPGSNSSGTTPGRVYKGKRAAGHMGSEQVTVQALRVQQIDLERNLLIVRGSVPGAKNSLVFVKISRRQPKQIPATAQPAAAPGATS